MDTRPAASRESSIIDPQCKGEPGMKPLDPEYAEFAVVAVKQDDGLWSDTFLRTMRETGDPLADNTVYHMLTEHGIDRVNTLLQDLIKTDDMTVQTQDLKDEVSAVLEEYLELSRVLPYWADEAKMEEAAAIFREYGLLCFSLLGCYSLPMLYTCGNGGTQVLINSNQLTNHVYRRILETAQFMIDVMSVGGLSPDGRGLHAIQRVRLMHAAIRTLIQTDQQGHIDEQPATQLGQVLHRCHNAWQPEWGVPINQETMGATILTFSYIIIDGLRTYDVHLTPQQEEAFIHCWSVIGHLMGIREEFLRNVTTMEQAKALFDRIIAINLSRTPAEAVPGRELNEALLRYMAEMIQRQTWLGRFDAVRHIPKLLMLELIGPQKTELLGIRLDPIDRLTLFPFRVFQKIMALVMHDGNEYARHADWLYRMVLSDIEQQKRESKGAFFRIPDELVDGWKLTPVGKGNGMTR